MKLKDIREGEEYLVGPPNARAQFQLSRVQALKVGVHSHVWDGWGSHRSERPDYVEVQYLDKETGEPTRESTVHCRQFRGPWIQEEQDEIQRLQEERERERKEEKRTVTAAAEKLRELGLGSVVVETWRRLRVEIPVQDVPRLMALVEAVEAAHDTLLALCPNLPAEANDPQVQNSSSEYGAHAVETFRTILATLGRAAQ